MIPWDQDLQDLATTGPKPWTVTTTQSRIRPVRRREVHVRPHPDHGDMWCVRVSIGGLMDSAGGFTRVSDAQRYAHKVADALNALAGGA